MNLQQTIQQFEKNHYSGQIFYNIYQENTSLAFDVFYQLPENKKILVQACLQLYKSQQWFFNFMLKRKILACQERMTKERIYQQRLRSNETRRKHKTNNHNLQFFSMIIIIILSSIMIGYWFNICLLNMINDQPKTIIEIVNHENPTSIESTVILQWILLFIFISLLVQYVITLAQKRNQWEKQWKNQQEHNNRNQTMKPLIG